MQAPYSTDELQDVVAAWMPYLDGINPFYLPDLWIFALARKSSYKPFGAEDLAAAWPEFSRRKRDAVMMDYYDELDTAKTEVQRKAAEVKMERRLRDL